MTSISTSIRLGNPFTNVGPLSGLVSAFNIGLLQISGTSSGGATGPGNNYPGGMTVVVNTGNMVNSPNLNSGGTWSSGGLIPTTFTNNGPNTLQPSTGFWAQNIQFPVSGTGLQFNYLPSLAGGNSPDVVLASSFASTGTGNLYFAFPFELSPNWSFSLASGIKLIELQTVNSGNNHVFALNCQNAAGNPDGVSAYPQFLLQGTVTGDIPGGGGNGTGLPPFFTAPISIFNPNTAIANIGGPNRGSKHILECLIQKETPTGTGNNGQLTFWVDNTVVWTSVGKNDGTAGQTGINFNSNGWSGWRIDPTYGGDSATDHPPSGCFTIYDWFFFAVS